MTVERDYLERTIATVRNHRDADNCWPQWANIFADEIERLWRLDQASGEAGAGTPSAMPSAAEESPSQRVSSPEGSASQKLHDRLFGEDQYEALDVDERAAVVAVIRAAEFYDEHAVVVGDHTRRLRMALLKLKETLK